MSNRKKHSVAAALPVACVLLLAGTAAATAQQHTPTQRFLDAIGLVKLPQDPIDYRERAPLVVPPSAGLIPPQNPGDIAGQNPDWPVDHDARRRGNNDDSHMATSNPFYSNERLGIDEMTRRRLSRDEGTRREAANRNVQTGGQLDATGDVRLSPTQLGFRGWNQKQEERVVFTGEPERRSLTQPPPGLRTPSTNAPYGVVSSRPNSKPMQVDRQTQGLE